MHRQADRTQGSADSQASQGRFALLGKWDSRDAAVTSCRLIDIPAILSSVGRQMSGKVVEGHNCLLIQGTEIGDIAFIERLRVVGEHDAAIVSYGRDSYPRPRAPEKFLLFLGRAINLLLVSAAFDPEPTIRVAGESFGFVIALGGVATPIVLFHPSVHVFHVKGNHFPEPWDCCFEIADSGSKQPLQEGRIELTELLTQPLVTRQRRVDIKAIRGSRVQNRAKPQFENQQWVAQEKAAQLGGGEHAFTDANEKGFQLGADRMSRASTRGTLSLPLLDHRPIQKREEGTILGNQRIMIQKRGQNRLVKESGSGYHSRKLLCVSGRCCYPNAARELFLCQGMCSSPVKGKSFLSNTLLAPEMLEIRVQERVREKQPILKI